MKFIDFFSGIGGFHTGLEKAGMKCIGWCEFDKFAQASYRAMYDTDNLWFGDDVTKVKGKNLPNADLWTFGFPCQDVSIAGKQKGKGYMLMLAPRSSMSKTPLIIPNSFGVIDADYRGEIKAILHNTSDTPYLIQKGDRLVQGILVPVGALKLLEVAQLTETVRGAGGIGSTGK